MFRRLLPLLLCLIPFVAHAQDETAPVELSFYNHPTERYNVLIPPGWDNLSSDDHAHLRSPDLNADLYALSLPATDTDSTALAVLALAQPDVTADPIPADDVTLTTGAWAQRLFALPNGSAATAFVQTIGERTYAVLYIATDGTSVFVERIDAPIEDEVSADAAMREGLAKLGLTDVTLAADDVIAPLADGGDYAASYLDGDVAYTVFARPSSITTADVLIGRSDTFKPDHRIALTIVRDFFITPETTNYFLLGLAAVAAVMALFVGLLGARWRNLQKDEATLRQLIN
jgi:hypothetical protein